MSHSGGLQNAFSFDIVKEPSYGLDSKFLCINNKIGGHVLKRNSYSCIRKYILTRYDRMATMATSSATRMTPGKSNSKSTDNSIPCGVQLKIKRIKNSNINTIIGNENNVHPNISKENLKKDKNNNSCSKYDEDGAKGRACPELSTRESEGNKNIQISTTYTVPKSDGGYWMIAVLICVALLMFVVAGACYVLLWKILIVEAPGSSVLESINDNAIKELNYDYNKSQNVQRDVGEVPATPKTNTRNTTSVEKFKTDAIAANPLIPLQQIQIDSPMSAPHNDSFSAVVHFILSPEKYHTWRSWNPPYSASVYELTLEGIFKTEDVEHILRTFYNIKKISFHLSSDFCDSFTNPVSWDRLSLNNLCALDFVGRNSCDNFFKVISSALFYMNSNHKLKEFRFTNGTILISNFNAIQTIITGSQQTMEKIKFIDVLLGNKCRIFYGNYFPRLKVAKLKFVSQSIKKSVEYSKNAVREMTMPNDDCKRSLDVVSKPYELEIVCNRAAIND